MIWDPPYYVTTAIDHILKRIVWSKIITLNKLQKLTNARAKKSTWMRGLQLDGLLRGPAEEFEGPFYALFEVSKGAR